MRTGKANHSGEGTCNGHVCVVRSAARLPADSRALEAANGSLHVKTFNARQLERVSGKVFSLATSAAGLTKAAGCTRTPEQCGQEPPPAAVADAAAAALLWEETEAALAPWLELEELE